MQHRLKRVYKLNVFDEIKPTYFCLEAVAYEKQAENLMRFFIITFSVIGIHIAGHHFKLVILDQP